jgi:hypothetical protein
MSCSTQASPPRCATPIRALGHRDRIPGGAVSVSTEITLTPGLPAAAATSLAFTGHAFELAAYQGSNLVPTLSFLTPVTATIEYSDLDVRTVLNENSLALLEWVGGEWRDVAQVCTTTYSRDLTNNLLSISICQTGTFSLFGPTRQVFLPLIGRKP